MKKTLSMITLAAFALMLLGSCTKINERLDDLEKKVDGIENEDIASIESQVQSIESSIIDLKSIRDKVQAMSDPATGLSKRIEDLESFVSDVKKDYATKDWAKTTLVTMDEYEKTCDTVAKIALKVEGFDSSLKACADSLKGWVNGKFGGYYDIATIDAKLAELQEQVDGVDSLRAELAKTREEIDTAKTAIRAEYRAAITSAIETYDGKLTQALRDSIDSVNATIGTLTGRVGILETKVEALKGRVDSLENMIQTVTIVPAFSDGSVEVEDDTLFIDCIISPAEVVKTLDTAADFTILLNKVLTKAVTLDTVPTDRIKVFTKDTLNGTVSIKAYIKKTLAELGDKSLTVAVNVKKDKSNYTTEFVPVYDVPYVVMNMGTGPDAYTLKWRKMNLGATTVAGSYETCAGDYYAWGATELAYSNLDFSTRQFTFKDSRPSSYGEGFWNADAGFAEINAPFYFDGEDYGDYTKYTGPESEGDGLIELVPEDDAATVNLGNGWRMPTMKEFHDLFAACGVYVEGDSYKPAELSSANPGKGIYKVSATQTLISTYTGVAGVLFCDGTNKLFFPAADNIVNPTYSNTQCGGQYWSSTILYLDDNSVAPRMAFFFDDNNPEFNELRPGTNADRCEGFSIRPVSE